MGIVLGCSYLPLGVAQKGSLPSAALHLQDHSKTRRRCAGLWDLRLLEGTAAPLNVKWFTCAEPPLESREKGLPANLGRRPFLARLVPTGKQSPVRSMSPEGCSIS